MMARFTAIYPILFSIIFCTSCFGNNKELPTAITSSPFLDTQPADWLMLKPKVILTDKYMKILKTTYLINVYNQNDNNRTLDSAFYDEQDNNLDTPIYQKVFIKKSVTSTLDKLNLKEEELAFLQNQYDDIAILKAPFNTIQFEIISKDVFEQCRKNAKNFLLQDTNVIKKKSGILKLSCENKTVVLQDNDTDNHGLALFTYTGQIKKLNNYVIPVSFWESGAYLLYNKTTRVQTTTFNDQFIIFPNLKYMVYIWSNPYENTPEMTLYRANNYKEIEPIISYFFSKWTTPCSNHECDDDYLFESDNSIYIRVTPVSLQGFTGDNKAYLA